MSQVNTSITHIIEADRNIFEDLGFDGVEAEKLKINHYGLKVHSMSCG